MIKGATLNEAFLWLCKSRENYPDSCDVWDLRRDWPQVKAEIQKEFGGGSYRMDMVRVVGGRERSFEIRSSRDALILKALSIVMSAELNEKISGDCYHRKGRGGLKGALRAAGDNLANNRFAYRTDVKRYYASMDHGILLGELKKPLPDRSVLRLVRARVKRVIYRDGLYEDATRGISLGCPLSPLLGAVYLNRLDARMKKSGLFYARFMDDRVVMSPTRWRLKKAVRLVRETLDELRVEIHPFKTFVGKISSKGFDFLGYHLSDREPVMAEKTLENFAERFTRLEERGASASRLGEYVRRWTRWAKAGLEWDLKGYPAYFLKNFFYPPSLLPARDYRISQKMRIVILRNPCKAFSGKDLKAN